MNSRLCINSTIVIFHSEANDNLYHCYVKFIFCTPISMTFIILVDRRRHQPSGGIILITSIMSIMKQQGCNVQIHWFLLNISGINVIGRSMPVWINVIRTIFQMCCLSSIEPPFCSQQFITTPSCAMAKYMRTTYVILYTRNHLILLIDYKDYGK